MGLYVDPVMAVLPRRWPPLPNVWFCGKGGESAWRPACLLRSMVGVYMSHATSQMPDSAEARLPRAARQAGALSRGRGAAQRRLMGRRTADALSAVVIVVFACLQVPAHHNWGLSNDSYRYARHSMQILGEPRGVAQREATKAYCSLEAEQREHLRQLRPGGMPSPARRVAQTRSCQRDNANGLGPRNPRYERIFDTRPGYPLLTAPAIGLFGITRGMWLTSLVITAGASLLVVVLLRQARASLFAALTGQVLFLCSRPAWWSMRPLAEGAITAGVLAALLGAWWLLQGRSRPGVVLLCAALGATALVKYSTALVLAVSLVAAAACLCLIRRNTGDGPSRGRAALLGGLSAAAAIGIIAAMKALRLPGASETLQEIFTHHFRTPPVDDPLSQLLRLNVSYWVQWASDQAAEPLFVLLLGLGCWGFLRCSPVLGVLSLAAGMVGLATAAAHPTASQGDRLWLLMWMPALLGTPLAVDLLRSRLRKAGPVHPQQLDDAVKAHSVNG